MSIAMILGLKASALVASGLCLGIGFWMSKKMTGKMDEWLLMYDKKELERLSQTLTA